MKTITMYELLGLVKDGKAPKKIKYKDIVYELTDKKIWADEVYSNEGKGYIKLNFIHIKSLNDEVEILEEEKKIPEKLDIYDELQTLLANGGGSYDHNLHKMFKKIEIKQNEILDYLDYLKSKGDK